MTDTYTLEAVRFPSHGEILAGDLYRPAGVAAPPIVVMAHGFGAPRTFGLAPFARRFAENGLAVLVFDYRTFGESTGVPRALVDPASHRADYHEAIGFAKGLPDIDPSRLALWGTSFSGGHCLTVAAERGDVRAVVAQVPFVDGLASSLLFPPRLLPAAMSLAARDLLAARHGGEPVRVPLVAPGGGVACLVGEGVEEGYKVLIPPGTVFEERVPARILVNILAYRPIASAQKIRCPVLLAGAARDSLIPIAAVRKTAQRIPDCRLEELDVGHFDPYTGPAFEKTVALETAFLREKLGL
jgi:dienelactone hydrolase